ncbi:hypothetical protein CC1G_14998 [Coprinopsis cinerea okayama7|uniref:BBC1/AIM3 cysteine proteinase-fold domain-containing protein n=1 Tax=Coprinopsis cinerea (strain Okayama-7 / 130 / ATCC MYA-4618 / FGSC 9003) TaxID=240176 RepID=D6RP22_COPC7|nr:hypothetical protein CC1G_14998 [Coprinopsis cinerea okayama7\|eukprot:XP_002910667.1 hypothetical protein CC1G_14998 [Coprinopsis cinerea okayama7\
MSDQPDAPPKKVGSLRDRIAAFEKAGASAPAPAPAPAPRPKPAGFSTWKPKQPSPPSTPTTADNASTPSKPASGGMSVSDAKDSIVKGGSLKERMAALQGKGAFGAPPPLAPKPALEKPKWKPPPVVSPPVDDDDDRPADPAAAAAAALARASSPPQPSSLISDSSERRSSEEATEKESNEQTGETDPDEEERQRRAAIAARMARLGGTRVGMAPIFGKPPPPPPTKKPSLPPNDDAAKAEPTKETASPPPQPPKEEPQTEAEAATITEEVTESKSTEAIPASVSSSESHGSKSPPSMPVPAMPRRAAPPRKKASKPQQPPPPPPPPPPVEVAAQDAVVSQESEEPSQAQEKVVKEEVDVKPDDVSQEHEDKGESVVPETLKDTQEAASSVTPTEDTEVSGQVPEHASADSSVEAQPPVQQPAQVSEEVQTVDEKHSGKDVEDGESEESEEDEETRKRKVADRLARMGAVNPLALPRRDSSSAAPLSSSPPTTADEKGEQPLPVEEAQHVPAESVAPLSPEPELAASIPEKLDDAATREDETKPIEPSSEVAGKADTSDATTRCIDAVDYVEESQYDDNDSGAAPVVTSTILQRQSLAQLTGESVAEVEDTIPVPPPRVSHLASVEDQTPRNLDASADPEENSEEENEVLVRSQILVPPPGFPRSPPTDVQAGQVESNDDGHQPPLPVPHRVSSERQDVGAAEEQQPSPVLPRSFPPSPPPAEEASDNEEALPVRPMSSAHRSEGQTSDAEAPLIVPPPVMPKSPTPVNQAPPHNAPPTQTVHQSDSVRSSSSQSSLKVPGTREILDEEEGDPIDPSFHSPSRRTSAVLSSSTDATPPEPQATTEEPAIAAKEPTPLPREEAQEDEDAEAARRRTIAERMAKLGGIKFGAAPPVLPGRRPTLPTAAEEESRRSEAQEEFQDTGGNSDLTEEEEERARKERIATKLAGMGGMRIGMLPPTFPTRKASVPQEPEPEPSAPKSPPPPTRAPPSRPPLPPQVADSESEEESLASSVDAVKVEAEESEMEEVHHEDAQPEEAPPPPPARGARQIRKESLDTPSSPPPPPTRPPVPAGLPARRASNQTISSQRRTSGDSTVSSPPQKTPILRGQSDYVMVEDPEGEEVPPPLPGNRPSARAPAPSRPPPAPEGQDSLSSQWELPNIPTSTLEFGNEDLSMSWTEAEAAPALEESVTIVPRPQPTPGPRLAEVAGTGMEQQRKSSNDVQLSADDLMAVWGRVGVQVCEVATTLFEKSKKGLVGDGTYPGFVRVVLNEVPNAAKASDWGYLVYKQTGGAVQKRASDIMPGDLVELSDAKFKGHKGLQAYQLIVGTDEPVVGVISEFEPKKSKLRVFQANQHVGQQTVEVVSYRLDDLKSGVLKIYRVLEA